MEGSTRNRKFQPGSENSRMNGNFIHKLKRLSLRKCISVVWGDILCGYRHFFALDKAFGKPLSKRAFQGLTAQVTKWSRCLVYLRHSQFPTSKNIPAGAPANIGKQ